MNQNLQQKQAEVVELTGNFGGAEMAVVVGYQGCTCEQLTSLRRKLDPAGAKFAVVKNTLAKRAIAELEAAPLKQYFKGPTAVVWTGKDPVAPAKILKDFAKEVEKFSIKAGVLGDQLLDKKAVEALAELPSREQLIGKLLALINAPATQLVRTINAPASSLARLLGAWRSELEKKGPS